MTDTERLLRDLLDAVASENAGNLRDPFMYIWEKNWTPLRQRIEAEIKRLAEERSDKE